MSEKRKFLYFYSSRCKFCSQFSEMLERSPNIKGNFLSISIDDASIRLPPYLEVVPTIQIYDEGGRRQILSDKHAFEWLNQYTQKPVETEPFCIGEMGSSLSDCFSFLDGQEDNKSTGDKAYASLEQLDQFYITTPNEGSTIEKSGANTKFQKVDKLTSDMEKLQQQRRKEFAAAKGGPPGKAPDFTQPNGGSLVGRNDLGTVSVGKEKDEQAQMFQRKYDLVIQQRNADMPRRKVPTKAPNFESPNYKSQFVTSDMMQQANKRQTQTQGPLQKIDYKNVVPTIPKPNENPNFGVSAFFENQSFAQAQQHPPSTQQARGPHRNFQSAQPQQRSIPTNSQSRLQAHSQQKQPQPQQQHQQQQLQQLQQLQHQQQQQPQQRQQQPQQRHYLSQKQLPRQYNRQQQPTQFKRI